jgi:hypothetical protein
MNEVYLLARFRGQRFLVLASINEVNLLVRFRGQRFFDARVNE